MTAASEALLAHLKTGTTTTCNAWAIERRDGLQLGFTDHDNDLQFEGLLFKASTGLTASAIRQTSGMAVANTEVVGALNDAAISETDLRAGRYDGAKVTHWMVNWQNPSERSIRFKGNFGEIQWNQDTFQVELRGLADALNRKDGRIYQRDCSAVLGDKSCKIDITLPEFTFEAELLAIPRNGRIVVSARPEFAEGWFERGSVKVTSGNAKGLASKIKIDKTIGADRSFDLWNNFNIAPSVGDTMKFTAGCDKLASTCGSKFSNFLNFRGFPHVPGTDWAASYPSSGQRNDGGSLFK